MAQPLRKRKVEGINRAFGTSLLLADSMNEMGVCTDSMADRISEMAE
jgi:hypothetical protein